TVADINATGSRKTATEIMKLGRRCSLLKCNVADPRDVDHMVKETLSTFGRIDILVNSAGVSKIEGPAARLTEEDWDDVIRVNLKGTFLCCQKVGRVMIKQRYGRVINIGSIDYQAALPQLAAYCASKGGVVSLTKSLATEWARYNITLNVIAPSEFETPLLARFAKGQEKEMRAKWLERSPIPLARGFIGKPFEIVGATIFLASGASSMVTGHVLHIDGGLSAI
ncbi:MAG TPA: SDR family oxidoreductase, partial [Candidatus Acidoferrum sp.]|nr:SDR family oxidoreductase [Candidatus Acidoferrum sp.]